MSLASKDAFYQDRDPQELREPQPGWTRPETIKQDSQDDYSRPVHASPRRRRQPWWMFSFEKWSTFGLFIFFGGAILGYSLSRTPRMSFTELLKLTTPGEGYWYEKSPWKASVIVHVLTSIPASIFSVFCFLPITYYHWQRLHGFVGYVVSLLLVVSAATGAVVARRAYGGELNFQSGVYMTASAAAFAVVWGCVEAKRGAFDAHREWMLRAWFYNGTFVTARVTALISSQVITAINTYYSIWQCAEVGYVLETPEALAKAYPQCATSDALANPNGVQVSVHASWKEGDLGEASAMRATFGMALWIAMMLHFIGIELYLRATADESKWLRELPRRNASVNEQLELPYRASWASILPKKQGKLEIRNRTTPIPHGKLALVKVTAAAINPIDWQIQAYGTEGFVTGYPAILGTDGAGIIVAVGPMVKAYRLGDRVFWQGQFSPDEATFQQYALVDTEIISKIPENISDDQAATIPVGSFASVCGLFQKSGIKFPQRRPTACGKPILILGGSSSLGQYGLDAAIQLARIAGMSPIVTTSSARHAQYLKSLGATYVFDRNVDVKTIQMAFPRPVALAYDAISTQSTQSLAFGVLTTPAPAPGAHLAVVLPLDQSIKKKNADGKVSVNEVWGASQMFRELSVPFWHIVGQWIKEGRYQPNRVQLVNGGLAGIPKAFDLSRQGVSGVKIVIRPQV